MTQWKIITRILLKYHKKYEAIKLDLITVRGELSNILETAQHYQNIGKHIFLNTSYHASIYVHQQHQQIILHYHIAEYYSVTKLSNCHKWISKPVFHRVGGK